MIEHNVPYLHLREKGTLHTHTHTLSLSRFLFIIAELFFLCFLLDIDSARRLREEFSKICFETLLKYSFINDPSSSNDNAVITRLALSSMLNRCKEILQKYAHDERLHGKCPLPR